MNIRINVKNSSVDFSGKEINLEYTGCYLVTGPNGAGKTTILKDIVFSPKFDEPNCSYFAYAEQDPEKYEIKIKDYLTRFNNNVDIDLRDKLLKRFELTHLDLKSKITKVSGGELVKLNLIACIIKDTSFVFLDEPTNNLDEKSVEILSDIIDELAENRIIVVVSHDPRLCIRKSHKIHVEKNNISVEYIDSRELKVEKKINCRYPFWKIIGRYFTRPSTITSIVLLLLYVAVFLVVNHIAFLSQYNSDEAVEKDGSVLVYSVDREYSELGEKYAKVLSVDIDEEKYNSMILYEDIPQLAKKYKAKDIFIENYEVVDYIGGCIRAGKPFTDNSILTPQMSFPQMLQKNYMYQINYIFTTTYLKEGRYPEDYKNEIVLSENVIQQYYPGVKIGESVELDGVLYKLVGIHFFDICITSYKGEDGYFYKYSEDTYDDFVSGQIEYKKKVDMSPDYIYIPDTIVFEVGSDEEPNVIRSLFCDYPANNYRSNSYDTSMTEYSNRHLISYCLLANVAYALLMGLLNIPSNRKRRILFKCESESFDNYYLSKPFTFRLLSIAEIVVYFIAFVICFLISYSIALCRSECFIICTGFALLSIIAIIPQLINIFKKYD